MDKIPYYEPAYPEETHYSHVCRLAKLNGIDSMNMFSNQYLRFGSEEKRGVIRKSTGNLAPFFMSADIPMDYSEYVLNTTAYSYQAMFMDDYRRLKVVNRLYQIDNRFNYNATMDKMHPCFCKSCMAEKTMYKRLHQIPSVKYCPIHNEPLYEYIGTQCYEFDNLSDCVEVEHTLDKSSDIQIATFIQDILYKNPDISVADIRNIIKQKVDELGGRETFAKEFYASDFSGYFEDEDSVIRFVKDNIGQSKFSETKTISIIVYMFATCSNFMDYYKVNKDNFANNDIDESDFYDFVESEGYTLVSDFRQNLITVQHNECGTKFLTTPKGMLNGWACPHCSKAMSEYDFQSRMVNYTGGGHYSLVKTAKDINDKITLHHDRCDKDITISYNDFLFRGYRCACENRMSKADAEKVISDIGGFDLVSFESASKPATVRCKKCGTNIDYLQFNFISKSIKCKICNPAIKRNPSKLSRNPKKTDEMITQNVISLVGSEYEVLSIGYNEKSGRRELTLKHNSCGCECKILYKNFAKGMRCSCEGFWIQATDDEIKRYINELSGGRYECIDFTVNRSNISLKDTVNNKVIALPYALIVQELKRPTESMILPCDTKQSDVVIPRSAPMLFMEYLKDTFGKDGVFFKRDIDYDATENWISSTLHTMMKQGQINRIAQEIYTFVDVVPDWNKIAKLFYLEQNGNRHGCTYGRSFLEELDISVKYPAKRLHIISNRDTRMTSSRVYSSQSSRIIGDITLNVKFVPYDVTNENYKVIQVADYMGSYNNQNYPLLSDTDKQKFRDYLADVPENVVLETLTYFSDEVKNKVLDLINSEK